jgi:hypothetical protein
MIKGAKTQDTGYKKEKNDGCKMQERRIQGELP